MAPTILVVESTGNTGQSVGKASCSHPFLERAIETLLVAPAFEGLQWTSLQPKVFGAFYLSTAAEFVKTYRKTGKQGTLRLMASKDGPTGVIDADDVGTLAAHLLVEDDPARHNNAKYVLNRPEYLTSQQIVTTVEHLIGTLVEDACYQDLSFIDDYAANSAELKNVMLSIKHVQETAWAGECATSTTSKEVLEIAAPKATPAEMFRALLEG